MGRPVKASAPPLISLRATHTAFALNEDDFFADSLGRSQRGAKGDGPFDPSDASGYVPGPGRLDFPVTARIGGFSRGAGGLNT